MSKTKDKYMRLLVYIASTPEFHSRDALRQFKISNNFITAAKEMGLIRKVSGSTYAWLLTREPLMSDAVGILKRIGTYSADQRLKNTPPKQLTIKPIKRCERPVPQSIIELNEKISEYPILDVAIAFLAGMVVAAFFTLIWN